MGVRGLWPLIAPVEEYQPLSQLGGQVVAVDLSIWVCGDMSIKYSSVVAQKLYLRNLLFRTLNLLRQNTLPVIVIDGIAPKLKAATIKERQLPKSSVKNVYVDPTVLLKRRRLAAISAECCSLLDALGVPWVQSPGEAEALCAWLNHKGRVCACITNDGDAVLYGAPVIYRHFTMDCRDASVRKYRLDRVQNELRLSRHHLVLLALLCGCDYWPNGVQGIGKSAAAQLLASVLHFDPAALIRFLKAATVKHMEAHDNAFSDNPKLMRVWAKVFVALRDCPVEEIFTEFLDNTELRSWPIPLTFVWKRPDPRKFVAFCREKLDWNPDYSLHHLLPVLALWDLRNPQLPAIPYPDPLIPLRIVKRRVVKSIPSYEVEWKRLDFDVWTTKAGLSKLNETHSDCVNAETKLYDLVDAYSFSVPIVEFERVHGELSKQFAATLANRKPPKRGKALSSRVRTKSPSDTTLPHLFSQMKLDARGTENSTAPNSRLPVWDSDSSGHESQAEVKLNDPKLLSKAFRLNPDHDSPTWTQQARCLETSLVSLPGRSNEPSTFTEWSSICSASGDEDSFSCFKTPLRLIDRVPKMVA